MEPFSASSLYEDLNPNSAYMDKQSKFEEEEYTRKLMNTCTLYVGNLSFFSTESQIFSLFKSVGEVKSLIMGLNK